MVNTLKPLCLSVAFILVSLMFSCSKICDEGYEGKRCDVEIREKFIGAWNATDNPGGFTFTDTISNGTGILDVLILRRFGADTFNRTVKASISGNMITIGRQKPESLRALEIRGIGTITNDNKTINWNYDLINTTDSPEVIASYTSVWIK